MAGEKTQLANGLQIFSGGFPIFRGSTLVGALGISGDGIQQDALIAYIGIQGDGSIDVAGVPTVNNAPSGIRADTRHGRRHQPRLHHLSGRAVPGFPRRNAMLVTGGSGE